MTALIPDALYLLVGVMALVMAGKCLLSARLLPFHQEAAGVSWDALPPGLKQVVLALTRVSGLGFLAVGLALLGVPIVHRLQPASVLHYGIPAVALFYCLGLALVNHRLAVRTGAGTPWKGALLSSILLAAGIGISLASA